MSEKIDVKKKEKTKEEKEGEKKSREISVRRENPFSLFQGMDRLFDDVFSDWMWPFSSRRFRPLSTIIKEDEPLYRTPLTNITETDSEFNISAELPGIEKGNLEITIQEGMLEIKGEQKEESEEEKDGELVRKEWYSTRYYRAFKLPEHIDEDKIEANLEKGVLTLKIPKVEPTEPEKKKIEVK